MKARWVSLLTLVAACAVLIGMADLLRQKDHHVVLPRRAPPRLRRERQVDGGEAEQLRAALLLPGAGQVVDVAGGVLDLLHLQ